MPTKIEWCTETWNPVTGCTKVSPGCKHCYAERLAPRVFAGQTVQAEHACAGVDDRRPRRFTDVRCHPERLDAPLRWRKPRRVFVNSMSDLFHEDVPADFIRDVFTVMARAPQHTFQILTKRPERMRMLFDLDALRSRWTTAPGVEWPLPNVWLGVSVEDQQRADERIPLLLDTPAAVRFISAEPLLGPVDLRGVGLVKGSCPVHDFPGGFCIPPCPYDVTLDWIIVGGESGPGARPMDLAWARSLVAQARAAGVPVFVKQLGAHPYEVVTVVEPLHYTGRLDRGGEPEVDGGPYPEQSWLDIRDRKGGDPEEWPVDLRVREFPS